MQQMSVASFASLATSPQQKASIPGLSQRACESDPTSIYGRVEDFAFWANSDPKLHNDEDITTEIKNSIATTNDCQRAQQRSILLFFGFISAHPNERIRLLSEFVPDDQLIGEDERRFVVLTRGLKTPAKKSLVNDCLTIFAVNMYKLTMSKEAHQCASAQEKADAKYKPSSLSTFFKHLFAYFTLKQINYNSGEFKSHVGSFHAALKKDFESTLKLRPDLGVRKVAPVDLQAAAKVRNAKLQPFKRSMERLENSGYTTLLKIIAHSMGEIFMLRGGKEVSSCVCVFFVFATSMSTLMLPCFCDGPPVSCSVVSN